MNIYRKKIVTPVGTLHAYADAHKLYALDYPNHLTFSCLITEGSTPIHDLLSQQLDAYFEGNLQTFSVPLAITGTDFQRLCWDALLKIPYGKSCSYKEQAQTIGKPEAFRAVANANGRNKFSILIPCHRVIRSGGHLGGYGGGLEVKSKLLSHEASYVKRVSLFS